MRGSLLRVHEALHCKELKSLRDCKELKSMRDCKVLKSIRDCESKHAEIREGLQIETPSRVRCKELQSMRRCKLNNTRGVLGL